MLHNHDAEKSVIGALLQDELTFLAQLAVDDFDKQQHKDIFKAICSVHADKQPVDVQTVSNELAKDKLNYSAYLLECCRFVPTTANTHAYVKIVLECSRRRQLYIILRQGADKLVNSMNEVDTVVGEITEGLKAKRSHGKIISFKEAMDRTFDTFDKAMRGESGAIPFGISPLDKITGGIKPGQSIVLAGLPGSGKSALAEFVGFNALERLKKRVQFYTNEMTEVQYMQRGWAAQSGVNMQNIIEGNPGDGDMEKLMDSVNAIAGYPGEFLTDVRSIEEAKAIIEAELPDLVIIDYMQLINTTADTESTTARLSHISRTIKNLAHDTGIPIISISSLSRVKEGRAKVMPQQKDLRGSGEIEYDADVIIFLHTPEGASDPYVKDEDNGIFELCRKSNGERVYVAVKVDKNKQGRTGAFPLIFYPGVMRFTPVGRE